MAAIWYVPDGLFLLSLVSGFPAPGRTHAVTVFRLRDAPSAPETCFALDPDHGETQ